MAVFKGGGIFSKDIFVVFRCSVLLLAANYQCGTEAILMWTAPPPAWNQTIVGISLANIQTAVYPVRNGSTNVLLRWNYTLLSGQSLLLTTFSIGDGSIQDDIGLVISATGPSGTPNNKYRGVYSIYSTSQFSNLTINRVTVQENATFQCKLQVGGDVWAYNIRVEVTDPADITHISENQTVNENEEVTLNCSAKGMPTPSITWTRVSDNSPVPFPLTITGKQDEGDYRCTAENGIGNPASQVVYVTVENYHPIDTNLRTSVGGNSVVVNESFNITCSAQANPPAKYRFYKDQDNFVNDTTGSDVSFITTSVSERNKQVNYSCTPFNDFGDGPSDGLTLTVLYAPSSTNLTTVPNNTTLLRESNISLGCSTDANPDAHIYHFYLNESLIGNSSSGVFNTTAMEDGVYSCVPINTVGTGDNATVSITVVEPPSITIPKTRETVDEGDNITLTCTPFGKPPPVTTWTKLGNSEVLSNTSSLAIVNVRRPEPPDNMIQYQCTASNGVGTPATATVNVTVHYAPSSTNLITVPNNTTLLRESNISLGCSTDANPDAHIYYFYLNDNRIDNSSSGVFNTTVMADGVYTCVPINTVGTGENSTVNIAVVDPPSITIHKKRETVEEGDNITLTCNATGKPQPITTWTKLGSPEVLSNTSLLTIVNVSRPGTADNMIQYQCTASNGVGTPARDIATVTVHYAPDRTTLTTVPSNRTLLRHSILTLNCTTDASPEAEYHFYFNGTSIGNSSSGVFNTSVMADGVYTCVPINTVGTGDNSTVNVTAVVAPSVEISNETAIVVEGESLELKCNASGEPGPSVTWTKVGSPEVLSNTSSLTIVNVSRPEPPDNMIQYQCTASNGVGTPATATSTINVHYAASVNGPANVSLTVESGTEVNFLCLAMGNPAPTVNWTSPDDDVHWLSNLTNVTFTAESDSSGLYLCTVKNALGEAIKRFELVVTGNSFLMTLTVTNKGCDDNPSVICEQMGEKVKKEIAGQLESVTVKNCKCGCVTAYLSLDFSQSVEIPKVLSVLRKIAAKDNGFGEFQVDPGSIQAISDDQLPTVSSPSTVGTPTSDGNKGKDLWIIIGASVGGVIVLVVVVVVAWCVHHKRKCRRKGSKVRCSESEAFAPGEDNGSGHVNNGYADAGPRPTAMEGMSQHQGASAVPTYATVDKSAKKGSKKDKVEEQKPQAEAPQYAAVDKSKKKKKEEPEATYAQVDKSKKSKKKPKPGEVLYADLGDFQQMQELPRVSTSPQALPPIKKPTTYVETQYADITQFLKGDVTLPDSNNSQGPAAGSQAAPAPENSNSQEPGTNTKETSQASNPGGGGGPGHETNF